MDTAAVKNLSDSIRELSTDLKRCRAAQQILDGYIRLNSSTEGIAVATGQLQAAADELAKHSRQYAKSVTDLATAVTTTSTPITEEM